MSCLLWLLLCQQLSQAHLHLSFDNWGLPVVEIGGHGQLGRHLVDWRREAHRRGVQVYMGGETCGATVCLEHPVR